MNLLNPFNRATKIHVRTRTRVLMIPMTLQWLARTRFARLDCMLLEVRTVLKKNEKNTFAAKPIIQQVVKRKILTGYIANP